ncbi:MAG: T9SS type A sorting domain-containing protein [Bacteroidetes bacterium]|nr:T9SS type A sorting domain-containing protein [Bacteroidota bacterium]
MKIRTVALSAFLLVIILLTSRFSPTYQSGPPAGVSGSPGDGATCNGCHGGAAVNGSFITSDIPATGYIPGATYNVTATISHPTFNKFGFEISPQNAIGQQKGTLIITDPTRTQLLSGSKYIAHKTAGTAGTANTSTWVFQWQAPAAGSGSLSLYGSFIKANANNNTSGDAVFVDKVQIFEDLSTGLAQNTNIENEWSMYPLPCADELTIAFRDNKYQSVTVMIRSVEGKVITENTYLNNQATIKLNISELQAGVYLVTVVEGNKSLSKKLVKL